MRFGSFKRKTLDEWREGTWFAWFPVPADDGEGWRWVWLERVRYRRDGLSQCWDYEVERVLLSGVGQSKE